MPALAAPAPSSSPLDLMVQTLATLPRGALWRVLLVLSLVLLALPMLQMALTEVGLRLSGGAFRHLWPVSVPPAL
ncbi:hypothetical protein LPC08_23330 [Roseomonas sp. OT10]|uniref:hypothetical protein n=1 Tax=Roseomonas cutis TaxID=2897332 RepID=UPI001E54C829|nr:hypothetical protein [Roseomonas sp. OT10]UFN48894.1 hypothetical protein LPC08_23330 [Roseomonas sp. OT10]